MKDLRELVKQDPDLFKQRVIEWVAEGKTLKDLALDLDVAYATLYRICSDLGLKLGASVLRNVPIADWATKSKKQIGIEYLVSYQHVYNYYQYHKPRLEEEIREWKRSEAGGALVERTGEPEPRSSSMPAQPEGGVSEGGSTDLVGDETGDDGD